MDESEFSKIPRYLRILLEAVGVRSDAEVFHVDLNEQFFQQVQSTANLIMNQGNCLTVEFLLERIKNGQISSQ